MTLGKMLQPQPTAGAVALPYLRAANVQPDGALSLHDLSAMWFKPTEVENLTLREGDVVVVEGGQGGFGRAAHIATGLEGVGFQNSINRIRPHVNADGRFITYYLLALRAAGFIRAFSNVVSMPHLTAEKLASLPAPIPPLPQQRAIADYLDRETAQIDTLIEEQRRLIALALERRRSSALSASFFGVRRSPTSRNAEPWLPDTPTHWPIVQLGQVCDTQAGWAFPSDGFSETNGTRLLRGVNVKPRGLDWSDVVRWDEDLKPVPEEYHLQSDDLVFGMDRPFVGDGIRATRIDSAELPCLLVQRVLRLRARASCLPEYLESLVTSGPLLDYLQPLFTGVSVPHVSEWQVRKFRMPVPPLEEQNEIVQYIAIERDKIDSLISEAQRLIELSRERRAALITAAVIGQIDVGAPA